MCKSLTFSPFFFYLSSRSPDGADGSSERRRAGRSGIYLFFPLFLSGNDNDNSNNNNNNDADKQKILPPNVARPRRFCHARTHTRRAHDYSVSLCPARVRAIFKYYGDARIRPPTTRYLPSPHASRPLAAAAASTSHLGGYRSGDGGRTAVSSPLPI